MVIATSCVYEIPRQGAQSMADIHDISWLSGPEIQDKILAHYQKEYKNTAGR